MSEPTITCPSCGSEIKLTESLAAPLIAAERKRTEQQAAAQQAELARREAAIRAEREKIDRDKAAVAEAVDARMREQRAVIEAEARKKERQTIAADAEQQKREQAELQEIIKQQNSRLAEAQKQQAEFLRKQRELEDRERAMDLTVQQRVQAELVQVRDAAQKELDERHRLKDADKDKLIADLRRAVEEAQRKAEQGSQQLQGEVQELELEALLRSRFPADLIEPVAKGEFGGDALQRVRSPAGAIAGTILWESKRTKAWSDGWLAKLRGDRNNAKADLAVIVSQTLPRTIETFDLVDDVWVTSARCALPLAMALRRTLLEAAAVRAAGEGVQTKMELVYGYLTGPRFRQRVQAIVEAFNVLKDDLDREKKALMSQWTKREKQLENVLIAATGLQGDLEGIAGSAVPEIEGLGLRLLERDDGA